MASKNRYPGLEREADLKRQALQVAVQLPENADDALKVLDLARGIVTDFLMDEIETERHSAPVVTLTLIR